MLFLVRRHDDDLAPRLRQPSEPVTDGGIRTLQRCSRGRLDLLSGREVQRRILSKRAQRIGQAAGAEQPVTELDEFGVDPPDLIQTDGVHVFGDDVERGVRPGQEPICLGATGDVPEARSIVRSCARSDLVDDDGAVPLEGGPDLLADDLQQLVADRRRLVRRLGQRPLGIWLVQELVELLDDLRAEHRDCRASLCRAASKVGDGLVEIGGHGAPALEEGIGLGGRADRLVGGDVQQIDLRPVHRVDVEGGDVGVEDCAVDPQRVGEGRTSGRVPLVANVGQLELEPVEERAPRLVRLARVVLETVVEASVAERRGEGRVATKGRLPIGVGEAVKGGRCGCGAHAVMLATAGLTG